LGDGGFCALGFGFVSVDWNVDAAVIELFYDLDGAFVVEADGDNAFFGDFGVEDAAFFGFLTDIVPKIVIEGGLGCGGAHDFEDIAAGVNVGGDLRDLDIAEHVAAFIDGGGAGGEEGGCADYCYYFT